MQKSAHYSASLAVLKILKDKVLSGQSASSYCSALNVSDNTFVALKAVMEQRQKDTEKENADRGASLNMVNTLKSILEAKQVISPGGRINRTVVEAHKQPRKRHTKWEVS